MAKKGKKKKHARKGKKVRVDFRANRSSRARDRNWTRRHTEGEEIESGSVESVVAKGDLSRKRTIILSDEKSQAEEHLQKGIVLAVRGQFADVDDGQRVWPCTIRQVLRSMRIRQRFPVACGDHVLFSIVADKEGVQAEGVIEKVESRRSELKRVSGRREHVIAANIDDVLIVSSAGEPRPKPHLVDRYLVAAQAGGMRPVICMNKIDLDEGDGAREICQRYVDLGYRVYCVSTLTGEGVDELQKELFKEGRSIVLAGQSGVGKSSILNIVQPGLNLRVSAVSQETQKGRHTTTTASLIKLDSGGYVVDTPGVKSFDISAVPVAELELYFVEFAQRVANCKFPDCTHTHETPCAIKDAVESGEIHPFRYGSYLRLFEERTGITPPEMEDFEEEDQD